MCGAVEGNCGFCSFKLILYDLNIRASNFSKELPPHKRAPFEEMSRLDTKRYNKEMGDYVQQQQQQQNDQLTTQPMMHMQQQQQQQQSTFDLHHSHHHHHMRGAKRRRLKDPSMPKRSLSAFFFFCDHYRPKIRSAHPEWRVSEIAKELGRLWDECTDKGPYELKAQNDKLRYEEVGGVTKLPNKCSFFIVFTEILRRCVATKRAPS